MVGHPAALVPATRLSLNMPKWWAKKNQKNRNQLKPFATSPDVWMFMVRKPWQSSSSCQSRHSNALRWLHQKLLFWSPFGTKNQCYSSITSDLCCFFPPVDFCGMCIWITSHYEFHGLFAQYILILLLISTWYHICFSSVDQWIEDTFLYRDKAPRQNGYRVEASIACTSMYELYIAIQTIHRAVRRIAWHSTIHRAWNVNDMWLNCDELMHQWQQHGKHGHTSAKPLHRSMQQVPPLIWQLALDCGTFKSD